VIAGLLGLLLLWWLERVRAAGMRQLPLPAVVRAVGNYFVYLAQHKYFVGSEGLGLEWPCAIRQLVVHDWSKFMPCEFGPYAYHFYVRTNHDRRKEDPTFDRAWLHHIHLNPHHWDYWVLRVGHKVTALRVPEKYLREMAADWLAMARQRGKPPTEWYEAHQTGIHMHPASKSRIQVLIGYSEELSDVAETGEVLGI
jgi:hypothetical protein